jgi:hypothetical protein
MVHVQHDDGDDDDGTASQQGSPKQEDRWVCCCGLGDWTKFVFVEALMLVVFSFTSFLLYRVGVLSPINTTNSISVIPSF